MLTIVAYITALIFELLQANYTNNISANEHFLDNMYRIVSILWIKVKLCLYKVQFNWYNFWG